MNNPPNPAIIDLRTALWANYKSASLDLRLSELWPVSYCEDILYFEIWTGLGFIRLEGRGMLHSTE